MIYETFSHQETHRTARETVLSISRAGVLEATILMPTHPVSAAPLLALHGISRNATELAEYFASEASGRQRAIVIPHFTKDTWPVFQRVSRRARPDRALLNLISTLRSLSPVFDTPFDLFGFSGGAQLAHRFAMLYPELVGDLHLASAGWYTLPDTSNTYPYGMADASDGQPWARLMRTGFSAFVARRIHVYVGDADTVRDASLRTNPELDLVQGRNRLERARNYVARINECQIGEDLTPSATLRVLPGCGHNFGECAAKGALISLVCAQ